MKRTALITGASSGVGLEFAHIFASKGANLVLVDHSREKLGEFKLKMEKQYGVIVYNIDKDLSMPNAAKEVYNELRHKKVHIDFLINNAGFGDFGFFVNTNWDKQLQMINSNIISLTYLIRLFLPEMIEEKYGRILNVASMASFQPGPTMSVYFAIKAYVLSFSEAIANELKGTGVTVTVLCPGATQSGFKDAAALEESKLFKGGRIVTPKEFAMFGYRKMMKGTTVVVPGFVNKIMSRLVHFAPRDVVTSIAKKKLKSK